MKRLLLLTVIVAIAVSAVALIGVRSSSGPDVAQAAGPQIVLDLNPAGGWCTTINDTAGPVIEGDPHQVAICMLGGNYNAYRFNIIVNYTSTGEGANSCVTESCGTDAKCLDVNPDFISTVGTGWDCSGGGVNPPKCGTTAGEAYISCGTTVDPGTTTTNWAIAVIDFSAVTAGLDTLSFGTTAVYEFANGENVLRCPPESGQNACLGGQVTKEKAPEPTAVPPACDIKVSTAIAAVPSSLTMKVGDPPVPVAVQAVFTNGAVANAPRETCSAARVVTADMGAGAPVDPAKLGVRVEPVGAPAATFGGDVCLACNYLKHPGWTVAECITAGIGPGMFPPIASPPFLPPPYPPNPLSPWDYMFVNCDEDLAWNPSVPLADWNESCEDGIDNQPPLYAESEVGTCDWGGFSKLCTTPTTPDSSCLDIGGVGLRAMARAVIAPDAFTTPARIVKIECRARGTYPLVLSAGVGQASTSTAYPYLGPNQDPDLTNDSTSTILNVVCTKGPEMVKDCNPATESIETSCNLWLMDPNFLGKMLPEELPGADENGCVIAEEGKGCLAVDVWLLSADDEDDANDLDDPALPECLGAWEHQVRYDHKIIKFLNDLAPLVDCDDPPDGILDAPWLECEGRLISSVVGDPPVLVNDCLTTVMSENWIIEGCVSKDDPDDQDGTMQLGPCGDGIIEQMLIIPQYNDLVYRSAFRPTKDNGVVTNIVDDNCEITDIYAEPMADTLPGGLTPICGDLHITVRMLEGDIDLDCDVDVVDDQALAFRYGASWGLQLYDQWFDLEPKFADQDIDIKDLQFVFGRNYSTCQLPIPDDQAIPVPPAQPDP